MNDLTDINDRLFKYAVRRWISHHQASKIRSVLFGFRFQISDVDISAFIAFYCNDAHTTHCCRSRICTVSGSRNQSNIAVCIPMIFMISFNHQQTCIFSLRAAVWLQATSRKSGYITQILF